MNFKSEEKLYLFLKNLYKLGMASEGICYTDGNLVYKVFHEFRLSNEEYASILDESKITIFKNIQNDTYILPFNTIKLKGKVIGCIYNYVIGDALTEVDPLTVPFDVLIKASNIANQNIKLISDKGIESEDVAYNMHLDKTIHVIDTMSYNIRDIDPNFIYRINRGNFNISVMEFLIDNYFENIIKHKKILKEMEENPKDINILDFIIELKTYLSELVGKEINTLGDADIYTDLLPKSSTMYIRSLDLKKYKY